MWDIVNSTLDLAVGHDKTLPIYMKFDINSKIQYIH